MNIILNLPNVLLNDIFDFYNPYKEVFTKKIIKSKLIETKHLKKMCKDKKAQIVHIIYYYNVYDYEYNDYYGFFCYSNDNNGIVIEDIHRGNFLDVTKYRDTLNTFNNFTIDEKRFYLNYDYSNYEKINNITASKFFY